MVTSFPEKSMQSKQKKPNHEFFTSKMKPNLESIYHILQLKMRKKEEKNQIICLKASILKGKWLITRISKLFALDLYVVFAHMGKKKNQNLSVKFCTKVFFDFISKFMYWIVLSREKSVKMCHSCIMSDKLQKKIRKKYAEKALL